MKKGIKIFLICLGFTLLLMGSIYGANKIDKNKKIEKVGEEYYIYILKKIITPEEIMEKNNEIVHLKENLKDSYIYYDICMQDICGKDYMKKGDIDCQYECEFQQEEFEINTNYKINYLKEELESLNEIK